MSESKLLFNQLLKVQQEVEAIKRDSSNPFFKSKYFDVNSLLAELKPVLNKHGVVVLQPLTCLDGKPAIKTIIMTDDGSSIEDTILLPVNDDPQKMGAIITYFRRYTLQSLFLLEAEDNDAESAVIHRPLPSVGSSTQRTCESCGKNFDVTPDKAWAKQCYACWKSQQPIQKTKTVVNYDAPPFEG